MVQEECVGFLGGVGCVIREFGSWVLNLSFDICFGEVYIWLLMILVKR